MSKRVIITDKTHIDRPSVVVIAGDAKEVGTYMEITDVVFLTADVNQNTERGKSQAYNLAQSWALTAKGNLGQLLYDTTHGEFEFVVENWPFPCSKTLEDAIKGEF